MFCLAPNHTKLFHFTSLLSNSLPLPNLFNAPETYLLLNAGIQKNSSLRSIGDYLSFFTESCFLILLLLLSVTNLES